MYADDMKGKGGSSVVMEQMLLHGTCWLFYAHVETGTK
jgi:hypothetical protein